MAPVSKWISISLFAVAMGYLEASVVIYLRAIYYPGGFEFPLKAMDPTLAVTELFREAATIIMITTISILVAKHRLQKFAWFLLVFGIWDIAYYVFLKLLLGWPETLLTYDILFLIPSLWSGPVLAPVLNSVSMIILAWVILGVRKGDVPVLRLTGLVWMLLILGSLIVLVAYMQDYAGYVLDYSRSDPSGQLSWNEFTTVLPSQYIPRSFDWYLYSTGVLMHISAIGITFFRRRNIQLRVAG